MRWRSASAAAALALLAAAPQARAQTQAGGEFMVNTYTAGDQIYPSIGRDAKGNFVVVWDDRSDYIVKGQRFDRAGNRVGAEFAVNTAVYGYFPAVAMGPKGDFVVVWSHYPDGSAGGIHGQRFDADANPLGVEFQVNTYTTGYQFFSDISSDAAGNLVIAWTSFPGDDGSGRSVDAQRYDANGNPLGANFVVNTYTTGNQFAPHVVHAPDGSFVVTYVDNLRDPDDALLAKRYDSSGNPIGGEFQVNTTTPARQGYGDVAMDAQGNFVVAWWDFASDGSDRSVFARRFLADGTPRGADFLVNTYTTGQQIPNRMASTIASDEVGNFVITWWSRTFVGGGFDNFAQRYGGLHPNSLAVDTTDNLVWEPGETVDVRPNWFNANGASQSPGGDLANITGPGGAAYAITAGTAVYPAIDNNASASCTDCYMVSVDHRNPRPVQHWDASAIETLTPDTLGEQKRWRLHIGGSFSDVSTGSGFYRFIETLLHHGLTGGCGGTNYCPADSATRDQMAVFVLVAKEGSGYLPPACGTPQFPDVPASSPFCRWVEELARRGVVTGCGGGNYCPADPVTREQMAVFVLRTLDPSLNPPACAPPNLFADVPETSPFCRWIEELANRGVVTGCGGGSYCPTQAVTREQMAVFLAATFGLRLYAP